MKANLAKEKKINNGYFSAFLINYSSKINLINIRKNFIFSIRKTEGKAVIRNRIKRRFKSALEHALKTQEKPIKISRKVKFFLYNKSLNEDYSKIQSDVSSVINRLLN